MMCPRCLKAQMQEKQISPTQYILFCSLCSSRITLTLQGNTRTYFTLSAEVPRDWSEFDRVTVPRAFQDAFEEVLEP